MMPNPAAATRTTSVAVLPPKLTSTIATVARASSGVSPRPRLRPVRSLRRATTSPPAMPATCRIAPKANDAANPSPRCSMTVGSQPESP
jgi:hypothetical protein